MQATDEERYMYLWYSALTCPAAAKMPRTVRQPRLSFFSSTSFEHGRNCSSIISALLEANSTSDHLSITPTHRLCILFHRSCLNSRNIPCFWIPGETDAFSRSIHSNWVSWHHLLCEGLATVFEADKLKKTDTAAARWIPTRITTLPNKQRIIPHRELYTNYTSIETSSDRISE